ncbi:MGH1-like glycoside hydrolase domain-containing protein [Roseisalinus antarcticus]|uniref:Mannosyl oligosaccharide glucosidase n=1 Tax=Roseisalinus antarcticus TaxID=254357 RepID=A0A1Y5T065_9RHOB|nr:glucosidase [Roseisalinus antarcticus]SLN52137.1 Mannosyl oligosaccharide glucosidase [Roseisalinus antarcticus]
MTLTAEDLRLSPETRSDWLRWGPYLSERQWGTVREDYSAGGTAWDSFPHDHARSRAYRWGEDGIAGFSDDAQRVCFALALWNGKDPILKERLFGLTNDQGNHGEDVKEIYHYRDATPSHSSMRMAYRYPQCAYPYADLIDENGRRKGSDPSSQEYELLDTGAFDEDRFFDVEVEFAKRDTDDILIRITAKNRGPDPHRLCLLPTLWFRNTWSWDPDAPKPQLGAAGDSIVCVDHPEMAPHRLVCPEADALLFCDNETNAARLYGVDGPLYPKDGINDHVVSGAATVNPEQTGTKVAALYDRVIGPGETAVVTLRLVKGSAARSLPKDTEKVFDMRRSEADDFHAARLPHDTTEERRQISRQALAGMLWSKQFFYYGVADWLDGDQMPPPEDRKGGRNAQWRHFNAQDIVSMPDCWEYPWFASWDLCFHAVALARADVTFAKDQVLLLMREWYMHPEGQVPAYEWAFGDVNPPLQPWAALRIAAYEQQTTGKVDLGFLRSVFDHGLLYFTWWVNRKDAAGNNLFQGGFLGLDNIAVFDRSAGYLPGGGRIYQSDGTTWVGFFALQMMEIAQILAEEEPEKNDFAAKFFQHFVYIADAMDHVSRTANGSASLWDAEDGLYYDVLEVHGTFKPLKARSLVSLIPMIAASELDVDALETAENGRFHDRLTWFRNEEATLLDRVTGGHAMDPGPRMLSFLSKQDLARLLQPMLDEAEFLSAHGIRSMSKRHEAEPFRIEVDGETFEVGYQPAESKSGMFGGNSNWRGPVWMPMNYLLVDALRRYDAHYGEGLKVECPTGSGQWKTLGEVADEISERLIAIFETDPQGRRPVNGGATRYAGDGWRDDILFYEYFNGDNGAGIGAAHQTGWTGLVAVLVEEQAVRHATRGAGLSLVEQASAWTAPDPVEELKPTGT